MKEIIIKIEKKNKIKLRFFIKLIAKIKLIFFSEQCI